MPCAPNAGPAKEIKMSAPHFAVSSRSESASSVPTIISVPSLRRMCSGTLLAFRTKSVRRCPSLRAISQNRRPIAPRSDPTLEILHQTEW